MSNVVREDIDNLNASLTITVARSEYEPKFNAELNKYRKQAAIRGFRRGKAPISVLKKMFGKSVLVDVINEQIQRSLLDYLREEKMNILGQPIASEEQEEQDFDPKDLKDYQFKFDLGLAPEFEIQGLDTSNTFECLKVEMEDKIFEEELENARKRHGERVQSASGDSIREDDLLKLKAVEIKDGAPVEDGVTNEFSVLYERLSETVRNKLQDMKVGDAFQHNILELEDDTDESYVRKYFLEIDEETAFEPTFEFTVAEASHIEPAAVDEELFGKWFENEEITTLEAAKEQIAKEYSQYYDRQAESLLFRDFQDDLMEKNQLDLPNDFLKRWLKAGDEKLTDEIIEKEYKGFARNLQWTLIRDKIMAENEIEVAEEEVVEAFKAKIRGYFAGNPMGADDSFINGMVGRMLEDEKQYGQIEEELILDKVFEAVKAKVNIKDKVVDQETFARLMEEARAEADQSRLGTQEEE